MLWTVFALLSAKEPLPAPALWRRLGVAAEILVDSCQS